MLKSLRFFALCVFALGLLAGFYLLPAGQAVSDTGNSPLYAASLTSTTDHISGGKDPVRSGDGKGGGEGNFVTCEVTCGPTCNQTTCGSTCVSTCVFTCANTCQQATCSATCVATCAQTCANTCSQATCASTCVITCSYTCQIPIDLISFGAQAQDGAVVLNWSTATEIDNFHFVIYRATDPQAEFQQIASIPCQGSGASTTSYQYVDANTVPGVTYYYQISDVSIYGYETLHQNVVSASVRADMAMAQNYPNPFNPETTIRFTLPSTAQTRLDVYDMGGRLVKTLVNGNMPAGNHQVKWNASDVPSGMYLYRLTAGTLTASGKMVYVK